MDKVLIDIGSNKLQGYRKLVNILGITDEWGKVFIEPNPENYEYLESGIKKIPNAELFKKAVNSTGNKVTLTTREDRSGDIAATIYGRKYLDDVLKRFNQKTDGYNEYEVEAITLSEILLKHQAKEIYIKMDCEGAEYEILLNLPDAFLTNIKALFVEFHDKINNNFIRERYLKAGIIIQEWE